MTAATLIHRVNLVPVGGVPAPDDPVDLRICDGVVAEIAPSLTAARGEDVVNADGRWAIPGLWDQHVHLSTWARTQAMVDLAGTTGPQQVLDRVSAHLGAGHLGAHVGAAHTSAANRSASKPAVLSGFGFRSGTWTRAATVAELDAVTGDVPTVLTSGDAHNGWVNTAALRRLGQPDRAGPLEESEWFDLQPAVAALVESQAQDTSVALATAIADASALGIVGVVDLEMPTSWRQWAERGESVGTVRVRASVYPSGLDDLLAAGIRTGDPLADGAGLVTMGPLKIISDGSLNTLTAWCCQPYGDLAGRQSAYGTQNFTLVELVDLLRRGDAGGLEIALHAIGDQALDLALRAFEMTGAHGSIEHAQLVRLEDLPRMSALSVRASVQPAHLLDDRDVTAALWADRADRCFALRSMLGAGVRLAMGSDAPVAPLDPWLAMAAAVHRSADDREPWNPAESLTAAEALAASTDGATTLGVGSPADVVLLEADPLASGLPSARRGSANARNEAGGIEHAVPSPDVAAHLRTMPVAATYVAGRAAFFAL